MYITMIRHALPVISRKEVGQSADPELAEEGHDQVSQLVDRLQTVKFDAIYTSPMRRALQTARPVAGSRGMTAIVKEELAEIDRRENEYIPMEKLREIDYQRWYRTMKGEVAGGACLEEFGRKVINAIEDLINEHPSQHIALICHGGVINAFASHVLGMKPRLFFLPKYTSIQRFAAARSGERSILTLGEAVHLEPRGPSNYATRIPKNLDQPNPGSP